VAALGPQGLWTHRIMARSAGQTNCGDLQKQDGLAGSCARGTPTRGYTTAGAARHGPAWAGDGV